MGRGRVSGIERPDVPDELLQARASWEYRGRVRPSFAAEPGEGQESVWDYPRPPRLDPDDRLVEVRVRAAGRNDESADATDDDVLASSRRAIRVLETAGPPVFYLPPGDVRTGLLERSRTSSICEWKGRAAYWSVRTADLFIDDAAWSYPDPFDGFEAIAGYFSFYPGRVACLVAGERVRPQPGGVYGGWLTDEIVGPVKGGPGTGSW